MNKNVHFKLKRHYFLKIMIFIALSIGVLCQNTYAATPDKVDIPLEYKMQQHIITLKIKDKPLETLLEEIQRQSSINFMIQNDAIEIAKNKFSINAKNVSVDSCLRTILDGSGLDYVIKGEIVTIYKTAVKVAEPTVTSQQKTIDVKGIVFDADGKPISGATVIAASGVGSITDNNGAFILSLDSAEEIEVSCIGYVSQKINITKSINDLKIKLNFSDMEVEDVVVNGVFERKANTFTGAVKTLNKEQLKMVSNSNVMQALKNIDPSILFVSSMDSGSDPNELPELFMRGKSNIEVDSDLRATYQSDPNAPLFILDGFEVSLQKVMDLDMNRVETMTILKDASAKAIYGSKAANGVIVIELKKTGNAGLRVTYDGSTEIQAPDLSSYNLTNAAEKLNIEVAHGMFLDSNGGETTALNKLYNQKLTFVESGIDTDWLSKPLQLGVGTKHGVSVEMGEGALKSVIDLSYNNIQGVMKGSDRKTLSAGISLTYRYEKFLFRNQLTITSNKANDSPYGSFSDYASMNPYYTPYDQYGNLLANVVPIIDNFSGGSVTVADWYGNINFVANPLYNANVGTVLQDKYIDITNNFDLQYFFNDNLKLTARFGITEQRSQADEFYPSDHLMFYSYTGDDALRKGSYSMTTGTTSNISGKFDMQYTKEFKPKHMVYFNAGFDISQYSANTVNVNAEGFPSDFMTDIIFARQFAEDSTPTGSEATTRDVGYYLSLNYSYDNRINFDGTFRQSASSLYSTTAWGNFWSLGASWNIHNEKWINRDIFSRLKLRGSIGSTGSQSGSAYNGIAIYDYVLDRDYMGLVGTQLSSMENLDLGWQVKNDINIGLEVNLKNAFSMNIDVYKNTTNNAVNPLTLVPSTGFDSVQENIGKIVNKGYDVNMSYTIWRRPKDRAYFTVHTAFSHNKNTLEEISESMQEYNDAQNALINSGVNENGVAINSPLQKYYDGVSMDAIWAVQSLGIDPANGQEVYYVQNSLGEYYRTYTYSATQQIVAGDELPSINGNLGFTFEYKGFSLSTTCTFWWGGQMYNTTLVNKVENADLSGNVDARIYSDRWREPGDVTMFKSLATTTYTLPDNLVASTNTQATTRFVQDRNELNVSSILLSYDFYRFDFVEKLGLERVKVSVNMNDVATFSSIEIERGTSYPFARVFNGSVSITF